MAILITDYLVALIQRSGTEFYIWLSMETLGLLERSLHRAQTHALFSSPMGEASEDPLNRWSL